MVRPRSKSRESLVASAMTVFWKHGFAATSVGKLVAATGVSRGGIYSDFGGKYDLFLACLGAYRQEYVEPALALLRSHEDGVAGIEAYFDHFIDLHKRHGMPGPGCFLASAMTECAPHDKAVQSIVSQHLMDLRGAFLHALETCADSGHGGRLGTSERIELAGFLATASQGLWSYGRSTRDLGELERFRAALLTLLRARLGISLQP